MSAAPETATLSGAIVMPHEKFFGPLRELAEPTPDAIEVIFETEDPPPALQVSANEVQANARPLIFNLYDELAPLFAAMCVLSGSNSFLPFVNPSPILPDIPANARTHISHNYIRLHPDFARLESRMKGLQIIWTLLKITKHGPRTRTRSPREVSIADCFRGCHREPLRFNLSKEVYSIDPIEGPFWNNFLFTVYCDETESVPAIRRQISLLTRYFQGKDKLLAAADWMLPGTAWESRNAEIPSRP